MESPKKDGKRSLRPLHPALIKLYSLLAVLIVLIPEWIAEWGLAVVVIDLESELPTKSTDWQRLPELRLSAMKLHELRKLAMRYKINGYSGDNRGELIKRLLKKIRK